MKSTQKRKTFISFPFIKDGPVCPFLKGGNIGGIKAPFLSI